MKTVLCVFGTRPEAVKMAPVILGLRQYSDEFACRVVISSQHREMLQQALALFDLEPDHDLQVMTAGQTLTDITVRALQRLEPLLRKERPNLVLVQGDTTTAFVGALAAFYQHIPVGHVEAGLRSFDYENPFPEEANRRLTDAFAALHFAPTPLARRHLLRENIASRSIYVTGNTGIDGLKIGLQRGKDFHSPFLDAVAQPRSRQRLILVTAHRRENFGQPLAQICGAIRDLALSRPDIRFVYPVHLNPNVSGPVHATLGNVPNIHLCQPLDYIELLHLMKRAYIVLTDSGGLQEEAPALGKPVLVLRAVTERPEAIRAGTARLVGTDSITIRKWVTRLLDDRPTYLRMARAVNPYGDGRAAVRTIEAIRHFFGFRRTRPSEFRP